MNKIRSTLVFTLVILLGFSFSSCSVKRKLLKRSELKEASNNIVDQVRNAELQYNSIEIKLSTKTDAFGNNYIFNVTYRNKRDSLIWISARAMLGIEAARLICNPDSVWIISRIARIEEKGSWDKMTELVGYPLDFNTLQGLLARKLFLPRGDEKNMLNNYEIKRTDSGVLMTPDYSNKQQRNRLKEMGFMPQFLLAKGQNRLSRTKLLPEDGNWQMDCYYGESAVEQFFGLPAKIKIEALDQEKKYNFDLKIWQVNLNTELKFAFPWF